MSMDRRGFMGAATLLAAPRIVFAQAATERRFVFVIQRGAADGLNVVIPYAEPAYAGLRGELAIDPAAALKLDGTFALHPALSTLRKLYAGEEVTLLHAVASPYRDRSHFDAQNVLETGGSLPYKLRDGWMNRLLSLLPRSGKEAIAFTPAVPLAHAGCNRGHDVCTVHAARGQRGLAHAGEAALCARPAACMLCGPRPSKPAAWRAKEWETGGNQRDTAALGRIAAGFLARADGPRIAMIETSGWDTHSGQDARLARQLLGLDGLIGGLREGMGAAWAQTVVLVATEFGRTVAANGTGGTDHGTAAAAMVIGGAVQGGRIVTDWPGLAPGNLFEGRDLKPTLALDKVISSTCAEAFHLDPERTTRVLFPDTDRDKAVPRLLRT